MARCIQSDNYVQVSRIGLNVLRERARERNFSITPSKVTQLRSNVIFYNLGSAGKRVIKSKAVTQCIILHARKMSILTTL